MAYGHVPSSVETCSRKPILCLRFRIKPAMRSISLRRNEAVCRVACFE
ncbi:MAG: hypothetical protein KHW62_01395 [Clostridiales bacterium]|nr:hypothetical protein [Clostridiales bacterium]